MKVLLMILALWPGSMLAQSCSQEVEGVKTAQQKLAQCKNKPSPEEQYNKEWTVMAERHKNETIALRRKHWQEHQDLMKKTGYNPDKK